MSSEYQQLSAPVVHEMEEKRSQFICHLFPVVGREQAMAHLDELKKQFPDARHHCWAYLIGDPEQPLTQAYSDDGEPGGTAGKPILHVLTHRHAGDTLAVVVRYFGGIKLGAGGLVRAYGGSVSQTLDKAKFTIKTPSAEFFLIVPFADEALVRHILSEQGAALLDTQYSNNVTLHVEISANIEADCIAQLGEVTSGRAIIKALD